MSARNYSGVFLSLHRFLPCNGDKSNHKKKPEIALVRHLMIDLIMTALGKIDGFSEPILSYLGVVNSFDSLFINVLQIYRMLWIKVVTR